MDRPAAVPRLLPIALQGSDAATCARRAQGPTACALPPAAAAWKLVGASLGRKKHRNFPFGKHTPPGHTAPRPRYHVWEAKSSRRASALGVKQVTPASDAPLPGLVPACPAPWPGPGPGLLLPQPAPTFHHPQCPKSNAPCQSSSVASCWAASAAPATEDRARRERTAQLTNHQFAAPDGQLQRRQTTSLAGRLIGLFRTASSSGQRRLHVCTLLLAAASASASALGLPLSRLGLGAVPDGLRAGLPSPLVQQTNGIPICRAGIPDLEAFVLVIARTNKTLAGGEAWDGGRKMDGEQQTASPPRHRRSSAEPSAHRARFGSA